MHIVRQEISFKSGSTICRAALIRPEPSTRSACIVMGPGFGGVREGGLRSFAEALAGSGWPVLLFDYRTFGDSEGEPRQWLSIPRQLADWQAAVAHARSLPGMDPDRIVLFGVSFSGGHVIEVAARDDRIAAVLSVSPMLDGWKATLNLARYAGTGQLLRLSWHGLVDTLRRLAGGTPHYLPVVGAPGSLAFMTSPDAEPGVRAIMPPDWRNEVGACIALHTPRYRPGHKAARLSCPILLQACEKDTVAPHHLVDAVQEQAGSRAEVARYAAGHFDIYESPWLDVMVKDQCAFLERVLL